MSRSQIRENIKSKKLEFLFFVFILLVFVIFRLLFPKYSKFTGYIAVIILSLYILMMIFIIRRDIKKEEAIESWLKQGSYKTLPEKYKHDPALNKIKDQDKLIKSYQEEIFSSTNDLKDYITRWTHQIKSPIFALNLLLDDENIDRDASKAELFEIEEYVQNILGFIRMDSDSTDYAFTLVDLDQEIKSSIKKYARQIIHKNNHVNFEASGIRILSDSKRLRFILDQILSNANKYTKNGSIKIYMQDKKLIIEDSGIGIKEEDLPRIFDQGYTGYNGRLDKKATGIGLSLVKNICNCLRIGVSAESKINVGTKIILDLSKIIEEK
jgi:two-component system sensor histidine kinase BraS/BceS